ncbi:MAG TPA: glycosyltransferase [Candidatus Nanoarchaeia archaeon]|nr:glycosyltransferase [Candidatus Nanoarchaeia archaeon]
MRLLYSCSELGLGHASRTMALGKRLEQRGHEVFFFSGGRAYELLKKQFKHVYPVTPVAWYENASGVITTASLINILFPLPTFNGETGKFEVKSSSAMETIHRYYDLREHLHEVKPDLLIADGDIHALRLAQRWKIPTVYVTNVVRPSYGFSSFLSPGERVTEQYVKSCTRIIIPDNKPPLSVCEYNVGDLNRVGVAGKTEFVGSFFDTSPTEVSEKHIFAPVSGPYGTRAKLLNMLVPAFEELGATSIISLGIPGERKTFKRGNCTVQSWLTAQERAQAMQDAFIVVFSGGHITCFETIKYAKPSICLPTQPEQLANAAKLRDMHCSLIAKNKSEVVAAVREIDENYSAYRKSTEALNKFSNKFDGLSRSVEIIEEATR